MIASDVNSGLGDNGCMVVLQWSRPERTLCRIMYVRLPRPRFITGWWDIGTGKFRLGSGWKSSHWCYFKPIYLCNPHWHWKIIYFNWFVTLNLRLNNALVTSWHERQHAHADNGRCFLPFLSSETQYISTREQLLWNVLEKLRRCKCVSSALWIAEILTSVSVLSCFKISQPTL